MIRSFLARVASIGLLVSASILCLSLTVSARAAELIDMTDWNGTVVWGSELATGGVGTATLSFGCLSESDCPEVVLGSSNDAVAFAPGSTFSLDWTATFNAAPYLLFVDLCGGCGARDFGGSVEMDLRYADNAPIVSGHTYHMALTDPYGTNGISIWASGYAGARDSVLSISNFAVAPAVPEPGTWLMVVIGVALVLLVVRNRKGPACDVGSRQVR